MPLKIVRNVKRRSAAAKFSRHHVKEILFLFSTPAVENYPSVPDHGKSKCQEKKHNIGHHKGNGKLSLVMIWFDGNDNNSVKQFSLLWKTVRQITFAFGFPKTNFPSTRSCSLSSDRLKLLVSDVFCGWI